MDRSDGSPFPAHEDHLGSGQTLQSPGLPVDIQIQLLWGEAQAALIFKAFRVIQICSQGWEPLCSDIWFLKLGYTQAQL